MRATSQAPLQQYVAEIQSDIAWWEAFDLDNASREALLAHLDESWERAGRIGQLHFRLALALDPAIREFDSWIYDVATHHLHQVLTAVGRRLVADNAVTIVEDVFFLEPGELRDALENGVADLRYLTACRAHELERQAA